MKKVNKILSMLLSAALTLSLLPVSALAADEEWTKEEVVYINLDAAGDVQTVDVVNIFDLARAGQIVDHGAYDMVRNMTTTDPVDFDGEIVAINAGPGRLYYEGSLPGAEIPWDIELRYLMDGMERSPEDIAGMSGDLEIWLTIRENPRCRGEFFKGYALQASFTLDGDRCWDIVADGATVANVGRNKQLTYTILPGRGADISIKARVTDFEMDAVAINGVPLSLALEVDDEALLERIGELVDAIVLLDEGAAALSGGVGALSEGAAGLQSGAAALTGGAYSLQSGVNAFGSGLAELNSQSSQLTEGSGKIMGVLQAVQTAVDGVDISEADLTGISSRLEALRGHVGSLIEGLDAVRSTVEGLDGLYGEYVSIAAQLRDAIDGLNILKAADTGPLEAVYGSLTANNQSFAVALTELDALSGTAAALQVGLTAFSAGLELLQGQVGELPTVVSGLQSAVGSLVETYGELDDGIRAYTGGVEELYNNFGAIQRGAASLAGGAGSLRSGAAALTGGVSELSGGAAELKQGTAAMRDETEDMGEQVDGQIESLLESFTGGEVEIVSFVSEKNAVSAVQFVIRTAAIQKPAPETPEPEEETESTFWQKLLDLFI